MPTTKRDRLLLAASTLLGLAAIAALSGRGWLDGVLVDTDDYMRLAFLEHALGPGGLRDYLFPRDGAPYGMQVHWTLPFNLAVSALAAPLAPFLGWHGALAAVAPAVGPASFLAAALAVASLARALGLARAAPWAVGFLAMAPAVLVYAKVGRVDHHVATVAMGTMALASAIRLARSLRACDGLRAAAWAALCAWQSMETVPALGAAWGVVLMAACLRARPGRGIAAYAAALPTLAAAALLADPPPEGALSFSADRFSAFHATLLAALACALPAARAACGTGRPWLRLARGSLAAAVPLAAWAAAAAASRHGAGMDPAYAAYFWGQVGEIKPAWAEPGLAVFALLPAVPATLALAAGLWRRRRRHQALGWLAAAAILAAEALAGALHVRLAYYGAALAAVVLGAMARAWAIRATRDATGAKASAMLGAFALAGAAAAGVQAANAYVEPPANTGCTMGREAASAVAARLPGGSVVAADIWVSPEMLWRTGLRGIAGPYHRNERGISDLGRVYMAEDDREARGILASRGAVALLACHLPRYVGSAAFSPASLQRRLAGGDVPGWLEAVPLPGGGNVRLYLVR